MITLTVASSVALRSGPVSLARTATPFLLDPVVTLIGSFFQ
jgi:hypothetical protein